MNRAEPHPRRIRVRELPLWMSLRDILLTLVAWAIIAYFLREALYLVYDYLRRPYFQLVNAQVPDWQGMWQALQKFVIFAVCLVLWLAFWALYSRKRLRAGSMKPQPKPLSLKEEADSISLPEEQLTRCKSSVITTVFFDAQQRIADLRVSGSK